MINNMKLIIQIFFISTLFQSCSFDNNNIEYEEQLVVFASINAGFPVFDTVFVSRTAGVEESVDAANLYIENANVKLINMSDSTELNFYSIGNGRYYPVDISMQNVDSISRYWLDYIIKSGTSYRLVVSSGQDSVIAQTNVPEKISITPANMPDYNCPDGSNQPVSTIDVNNLDNLTFDQMLSLYLDPLDYIESNSINVDSVEFKIGDCYTKSFASIPMFAVDFNQDDYLSLIHI